MKDFGSQQLIARRLSVRKHHPQRWQQSMAEKYWIALSLDLGDVQPVPDHNDRHSVPPGTGIQTRSDYERRLLWQSAGQATEDRSQLRFGQPAIYPCPIESAR